VEDRVSKCTSTCFFQGKNVLHLEEDVDLIPMNYNHIQPLAYYSKLDGLAPPLSQQMFGISVGLVLDLQEKMYLVTQYYTNDDDHSCIGTLNRTACTLESAIGEYEITIENDRAALDNPGQPTIIAFANNTAANYTYDPISAGHPSTLGSIVNSAFFLWESIASVYETESGGATIIASGFASPGYVHADDSRCLPFADPRPDVVRSLNKMMVSQARVGQFFVTVRNRRQQLNSGTIEKNYGQHVRRT